MEPAQTGSGDDPETNTQIGLAMDSRGKDDKTSVKEGMTKWGDVKNVFKFWGNRLRIWMDERHGKMTNDK